MDVQKVVILWKNWERTNKERMNKQTKYQTYDKGERLMDWETSDRMKNKIN